MNGKFVIGFALVFCALVAIVGFSIRTFGDVRVAAFAAAMSFLATALAALAAWGYLRETADLVKATKDTAREQARVAKIMEDDLCFRIAPSLDFQLGRSDTPTIRQATIKNIGRGVAVNPQVEVTHVPTNRTEQIALKRAYVEPDQCEEITLRFDTGETGFEVTISCSDSVGKKHVFLRDQNGRITRA